MSQNTVFGIPVGYPDPSAQPLFSRRNLINAGLALWVPIPAIVATWVLFRWFPEAGIPSDPGIGWPATRDEAAALLLHHPILTANLLFFLFVDLQFWLIAVLQRSSWLIDPYWTLLPPLLALFFLTHPLSIPDATRAWVAGSMLVIWSVRLTWNYFRREGWRFGRREDWRYAKLRLERPRFWLEQFLVVYVVQHFALVGLSLPLWAVAFRGGAFGGLDVLCTAGALAGVLIAHAADASLDCFMRDNETRVLRGEPKVPVLERGIWRLSRHPNYFGEQLFWWSIAAFGVVCGEPWVILGTAFNSCILAVVTLMTERRMLALPERRQAFEDYRRRTSVWVPWWPKQIDA